MAKTHVLVEFYAGDLWPIDGTLYDSDGVTPLDLTGSPTIEWTIGRADGSRLLTLTLGAGITITNVPNAQIRIQVTGAQSALVPAGLFTDQLKAVTSAGVPTTQWEGPIRVKPSLNP